MSKSTRNSGKPWTKDQVKELKELAKKNTPTRVIGFKLGRTEDSVRSKASNEGVSLKPTNQSPYNRKLQEKGKLTRSGGPRKKWY